jgi:POT family proton-dependent oligopeptide transporter
MAAVTIFQSVAFYQILNAGAVWISARVELTTPLGSVPVPWFSSIDSFVSIIAVPPLVALWRRQSVRGREASDVAKLGIGALIAAASAGLLALGDLAAGAGKVSALVPLLGFGGMGVAFLYYWPPLLALISRLAPDRVNATMVSAAYLSLFIANIVMGWVGGFYELLTPAAFWALDASIALAGALIVLLFGKRLSNGLSAGAAAQPAGH